MTLPQLELRRQLGSLNVRLKAVRPQFGLPPGRVGLAHAFLPALILRELHVAYWASEIFHKSQKRLPRQWDAEERVFLG